MPDGQTEFGGPDVNQNGIDDRIEDQKGKVITPPSPPEGTVAGGQIGDSPFGQVDVRTDFMRQLEQAILPLLLFGLSNPFGFAQALQSGVGPVPGQQGFGVMNPAAALLGNVTVPSAQGFQGQQQNLLNQVFGNFGGGGLQFQGVNPLLNIATNNNQPGIGFQTQGNFLPSPNISSRNETQRPDRPRTDTVEQDQGANREGDQNQEPRTTGQPEDGSKIDTTKRKRTGTRR